LEPRRRAAAPAHRGHGLDLSPQIDLGLEQLVARGAIGLGLTGEADIVHLKPRVRRRIKNEAYPCKTKPTLQNLGDEPAAFSPPR
jgi:hypothetical protein